MSEAKTTATAFDKGTKLFGGKNGFLILRNGKLYGLGDNSFNQISDSNEKEITTPCFIADNVISAAVGNSETAYVTVDGELVLFGNGKYAKGFSGFRNATQVLYDDGYEIYYIRDSENRFFGFGNNKTKIIVEDDAEEIFNPVRIRSDKEEELKNCFMWIWSGCMPLNLTIWPGVKKLVCFSDNSYMWHSLSISIKTNDDLYFDGGTGWPFVKFTGVEDIAVSKRGEYLFSMKNSNELLFGRINDIYCRDIDAALLGLFKKGASLLSRKTKDEFFKIKHITLE